MGEAGEREGKPPFTRCCLSVLLQHLQLLCLQGRLLRPNELPEVTGRGEAERTFFQKLKNPSLTGKSPTTF